MELENEQKVQQGILEKLAFYVIGYHNVEKSVGLSALAECMQ